MTITNADGSQSACVRVTPTGVPGLVIHPAQDTVGWTLTHVPTGASAGWWPEGDPEQVLACALRLGKLGDWDTADTSMLPLADAPWTVLRCGGSVPASREGPDAWQSMDADGELVITHYVGADAA